MQPRKLIIFPFNGNGIEALDCIDPKVYEFIGFIDDNHRTKQDTAGKWTVAGRELLESYPDAVVLAVPGSPTTFQNRKEYIDSLQLPPHRFATVIHPKAVIGLQVKVGINSLIMAGVVITSNAQIGNHVCILPNSVIHHDSKVGDYSLVGSGVCIAGHSNIGENCYIGSGTSVINGISIGDFTLVGIGSNVIKGVPANSKIAGNPAREIVSKTKIPNG